MKLLTAAFILLMGNLALACPDLAGTFSCTDDDEGQITMVVSQSSANGVTTYIVDGDPYVADGKSRAYTTKEDSLDINGVRVVNCQGNDLRVVDNSEWFNQGQKVADVNFNINIMGGGTQNLTIQSNGYFQVVGEEKQLFVRTDECIKQ